jgi:hypothetical protein
MVVLVTETEIDGHDFGSFLENCEWLDGTPCGKVVTE